MKSQNHNSKLKTNKLHNFLGEDKKQLLVTVDKQGNKIGLATREECHKGEGKPHLAFMVFVLDKNNNIILTKRSNKKSLWAGFWDASVVSHVLSGETPEEAAKRRGREELGVEVYFRGVGAFYYFAKFGTHAENEYCHVLIGKTTGEVFPNPIEIDNTRTMPLAKLKEEIKQFPEKFTPWLHLALEKIDLSKQL